ncbi:hypothetical protein C5167_000023, partial [Papaver somniferum]
MALLLALGRRANLQYFSVRMLNWRIGRGFCSGIYTTSRLEVPCKEEFQIDSYRVCFETRPKVAPLPDQFGGGIVLTMETMGKFSKVFSTVSASPLLPDVIPDSSPRIKVDYQGDQFRFNDRVCGSFLRRESARIIRAPIRPLFPAYFYHDVEVMARVLCCEAEQNTDVMAANATSAALMLSDIPWGGPIGVVRIGRIQGQFVINPSRDELFFCDLDLVYACTRDEKTLMADVQACEITEEDLEKALQLAHQQAVKYLAPQISLAKKAGQHKKDYTLTMLKESTVQKLMSLVEVRSEAFPDSENEKVKDDEVLDKITVDVERVTSVEKNDEEKIKVLPNINILKNTVEGVKAEIKLTEEVERILDAEVHSNEKIKVIPKMVDMLKKKAFHRWISEKDLRVDGRPLDKIRRLKCESTRMSELQGSSLFSREQTQVICTVTEKRPVEDEAEYLGGDPHLSVPRYSFKSRPFRVDGNWKIGDCDSYDAGDGNFVEKALVVLLPEEYRFPYVVRVNSQAIRSDGSVSTTAVCGGSIALMVSGVPLKKHVAGVSVGMVSEVHPTDGKMNNYRILTDLSSLEEHLVDMNFKVAGSRDGITAIRLDVNVAGIPLGIIYECLGPALKGRLEILDRMKQEISAPSYCTSDDWGWNDAVVVTYRLRPKSIELLTEPDGTWQRDFERETGARISMIEDSEVTVVAKNETCHMLAKQKIETVIGSEVEVEGPHEDEATTETKSYVEIPIEQVDQLSDKIYVAERQELSHSSFSGEDQLHRRSNLDLQLK